MSSDLIENRRREIETQLWRADTIAEWVGVAQKLNTPPTKEEMLRTISECRNKIADGNDAAFARLINVDEIVVHNWIVGINVPKLECFLKACSAIGVSLSELLKGNIFTEKGLSGDSLNELLKKARNPNRRNPENVQQTLQSALKEEPPPSVTEVASRLEYASATFLYHCHTEVCQEISRRHKVFLRREKKRERKKTLIANDVEIKQKLESTLGKDYPPSTYEIASDLGYRHVSTLYQKFPGLCYRITAKRAKLRKEFLLSIKSDLEAALKEEPPPSVQEVVSRRGFRRAHHIAKAFPELCADVSARYLAWRRETRLEEKRLNLQAALNENPPPPLRHVARRHGHCVQRLYKHYPELCRAISGKYLNGRGNGSAKRRNLLKSAFV